MQDGKTVTVKNVWFDLKVSPPQSHCAYGRDAKKEGLYFCLYYIGYNLKGTEQLRIISEPEHAPDFREIFKQKGLMERSSKMVSILLSRSECIDVKNQLMNEMMHLACDFFTTVEETKETEETEETNESKETNGSESRETKETKETETKEKKVYQVFAICGAGRHNSTMLIVGLKGISATYAIGKGPHTGTPYQVQVDFLKNLSAKAAKDEVPKYWIFDDFDKIFQPGAEELLDRLLILYQLPDGRRVDALLKRNHGSHGIQVVDLRRKGQGEALCVMPFPHDPEAPEAPGAPEAPARRSVKRVFVVGRWQLREATLKNITDVAERAATRRRLATKAANQQPTWRDEWYIPQWLETHWKSKILPKYLEQASAVSVLTINSRAGQRTGGAK